MAQARQSIKELAWLIYLPESCIKQRNYQFIEQHIEYGLDAE